MSSGVGSTSLPAAAAAASIPFSSAASDIANPVTHSALDFFEKPAVLVNYESSFDQEIFPIGGCTGPTLEFVVTGEHRNCIDMNFIQLNMQAAIYSPDGKDALKPGDGCAVVFTNNTLHSLFSKCEVRVNGVVIADSNNTYHHRAFLETELTTNMDSKATWAACQGYEYDEDPTENNGKSKRITSALERTVRQGYRFTFHGTLYVDFFTSTSRHEDKTLQVSQ